MDNNLLKVNLDTPELDKTEKNLDEPVQLNKEKALNLYNNYLFLVGQNQNYSVDKIVQIFIVYNTYLTKIHSKDFNEKEFEIFINLQPCGDRYEYVNYAEDIEENKSKEEYLYLCDKYFELAKIKTSIYDFLEDGKNINFKNCLFNFVNRYIKQTKKGRYKIKLHKLKTDCKFVQKYYPVIIDLKIK